MKSFRLYVNVDNDAFSPDPTPELASLLRSIAHRIERDDSYNGWYQTILDSNGNDVGRFAIKEVGRE